MTRRSIACLFLVGAGLMAAPAVANATPTPPPAQTCDSTNQTPTDDDDCGFGSSDALDLAALIKSFTGGFKSGM
ncbi:hypothetical protein ABIC28_004999 [Rhodococcus sp. PvR044]|uniref:hypothetical protein n=1 Tax=unclassified Rhodococcus (in: high G+C Gram-positive bacteria) TaxID=192944 RepID=UPI000BDAAFF6|nr:MULTISPECIES: hypothetical protein [unclassified Rhodococcus (in: high G+C Gram-positive bacteria)]MBP1160551.1 hypothetical protein [Rhodococcus sp. PvR099]PTR36414.1 hypothetical protein C8K38_1248 [Rhodococcus sp. OK611]SNX93901.1 hypothetical protein SAMN05447004_1258 [Rhodococcus sp. OK270]